MFLAAVGELMTEVAGEVADGIILHGFTTERYVREVTMPALERGLDEGGPHARRLRDLGPAVRRHRHQRGGDGEAARTGTKQQIAFYGSTPAYRGVLELHGWGDLQTELNALSKQGEWVEMGELIDDEMLDDVRGRRRARGDRRRAASRRYGDVVDRLTSTRPYKSDPDGLDVGARAAQGRRLTDARTRRASATPTPRSTPRSRRATSTPWPRCGSTPTASS